MHDLTEKCGIFGIYGRDMDVSRLAFFGLFALQHRGQESSGISVGDGEKIISYRGAGLVSAVYNEQNLKRLQGHIAIGHNRYSTSGASVLCHSQPIAIGETFDFQNEMREGSTGGIVAFAHNGNLPSVTALTEFLKDKNVSLTERSDSELMAEAILYYIKNGKSLPEAIREVYPLFTGAFSLVVATKDTFVAVRDSCGIRPLSLGKLNGGHVVASETCAFKTIGAEFVRDILPGEMVVIDDAGVQSIQIVPPNPKLDIFEFVYFARADSTIDGQLVYEVRKRCGKELAWEYKIEADIVIPIPETAIPVAIGYANVSKIPIEMALVKNRYVHRTFIEPEQHSRDLGVKLKLVPLPEMITGKRVVVMDDSIVRGTTSRQIVAMLFEAGAKEVHFLISSPPVKFPDFYGINTPDQKDLIASNKTVEEIRSYLGATSLGYLSLDGLVKSTGLPKEHFSMSCFTGEYPIDLHERANDFSQNVPKE